MAKEASLPGFKLPASKLCSCVIPGKLAEPPYEQNLTDNGQSRQGIPPDFKFIAVFNRPIFWLLKKYLLEYN